MFFRNISKFCIKSLRHLEGLLSDFLKVPYENKVFFKCHNCCLLRNYFVNPPSRDLWESPIRVHYSYVHKVLTCSAFGAIFCLKARAIGSAEFSNGLVVETTCSVPFIAPLPRATLESSLHSLIVDSLT